MSPPPRPQSLRVPVPTSSKRLPSRATNGWRTYQHYGKSRLNLVVHPGCAGAGCSSQSCLTTTASPPYLSPKCPTLHGHCCMRSRPSATVGSRQSTEMFHNLLPPGTWSASGPRHRRPTEPGSGRANFSSPRWLTSSDRIPPLQSGALVWGARP